MKKDFIKIYNNAYSKSEILAEKEIITKFIDFKERGRNSSKAGNVIEQEFEKEKSNCRVMDKSLQSLFYLFRNRLDEFTEDTQMNVIPEILLPEFDKIIHSDNFSFENYINELAEFNARDSVHNTFSNNRSLYSLMFKLNDFSEFKIIGCEADIYNRLLDKYSFLVNGTSAIIGLTLSSSEPVTKKEIKNFCPEKEDCRTFFESKKFYDYLVLEYFIDSDHTSFTDFKNVLTGDFETNKSIIRFECKTQKAAVLLYELQIRFTKKLSYTNIEYSKKFQTQNGTPLRQKNIAESISKSSIELKKEVKKVLDCFSIC